MNLTTLRGAALGLVPLLFRPLAPLVVLAFALLRRPYPRWLDTPDDPFVRDGVGPHRGAYEPTVVRVYERFGRIVGDVYWLGLRNVLFGFLIAHKAPTLPAYDYVNRVYNYSHLCYRSRVSLRGRVTIYSVDDYALVVVRLVGRIVLQFGWKVDRIVLDPYTARNPLNAEARPTFAIRRSED
jgi:hypothetical protein